MAPATIRRAFVAGAIASSLVLGATTPAHALSPYPTISQAATSGADELITGWAETGGVTASNRTPRNPTISGLPTVDDLYLSEHRPIPGQPSSAAMHAQLNAEASKLRRRTRLLPSAAALGKITLGASVALTGWQIGTAIRSVFIDVDAPAATGGWTGLLARDKGDVVNTFSTAANYTFPRDGLLSVTNGNLNWTGYQGEGAQGNAATVCCGVVQRPILPDGFVWGSPITSAHYNPNGPYEGRIGWTLTPRSAPKRTATAGRTYQPRTDYQPPTADTAAATKTNVMNELNDNAADYPALSQWLDSQLGGDSADPLAVMVNVPSCTGDLWAACHQKMMDAGLLTNHIVLTFNGADVTKPANAVISTSPAGGASVESGATVTVTTNPDTAAMPLALPAPNAGETYDAYVARLAQLGHTGTVTRVDLTETTMDREAGPSGVTGTEPTTGTRILPDTPVRVRVNPTTAPAINTPGLGMPNVPSIDFGPLMAAGTCQQFPFGVPCWVYDTVANFVGTPVTPAWDFHFPFMGDDGEMRVALTLFEPHMPAVRAIVGVMACLGMVWLFYGLAFGGAVGGGRDEGSK